MKKVLIIVIYFLFSFTLVALGTLRVESIEEFPTEHINLEVRGGSLWNDDYHCRSTQRQYFFTSYSYSYNVGFRVVRSP